MPGERDKLIIYATQTPANHENCAHEFWQYSASEMRLKLLCSIPTDYSWSNSGKWLPLGARQSVLINNPSLGQLCAWHGDILGGGEVKRTMLSKSNPISLGLPGSYYVMTPNALVGSTHQPGEIYIMTDAPNAGKKAEEAGPCSLLLYRAEPTSSK